MSHTGSDGRVLVITGASSGIGEAAARQAAAAGYRLMLAARRIEKVQALADELGGLATRTDIRQWEDNVALMAATSEAYGCIDAVFANAGGRVKRGWLASSPEEWHDLVLTNVLGPAYTIRAAIPALKGSRGHILLTGSIAGRVPQPGSFYSMTKHSVKAMAEIVRQDLHGTGIRVTLIDPGLVATPMIDDQPADVLAESLTAEDVARAAMFALAQPPHMDVNELAIRPTAQQV
jgi:NADP-dependent 3-hydroxy acid dehydrogenase YdfG